MKNAGDLKYNDKFKYNGSEFATARYVGKWVDGSHVEVLAKFPDGYTERVDIPIGEKVETK